MSQILKRAWREWRSLAGMLLVWALAIGLIWLGSIYWGRSVEVQIRAHEQEHAYCYTANKMFFVSIACVPKN